MAQPIAAAGEVVPRDGLAGALGYGVVVADRGADPLDPDGRWAGPGGYVLEGLTCAVPAYTASADFCAGPRAWAEGAALVASTDDQHPFVVGAAVECSTFGSPADLLDEYRAAALRALQLSEWAQIARELWTGSRALAEGWATNRWLASPSATVLSSTPVGIVEAVSLLEQAHASCSAGEVQLIHAPRRAVAYLDAEGIISTTPGSGRLWTANNSLVVADRGYPGTGPTFDPADSADLWLYSTGPLSARLGEVTYPERDLGDAVAASTNDVSVRAERLAAVSWLCCHLAVPVCLESD